MWNRRPSNRTSHTRVTEKQKLTSLYDVNQFHVFRMSGGHPPVYPQSNVQSSDEKMAQNWQNHYHLARTRNTVPYYIDLISVTRNSLDAVPSIGRSSYSVASFFQRALLLWKYHKMCWCNTRYRFERRQRTSEQLLMVRKLIKLSRGHKRNSFEKQVWHKADKKQSDVEK